MFSELLRYNSPIVREKETEMNDATPRLTQFIETVALPFAVGFLTALLIMVVRFS